MSVHRVLSTADYRRLPWKNGRGRTTEIATWPAAASLDAFVWRISIADIECDGPFSSFPGIDRTIVLIAGAGMRLAGDGHDADLRARFDPYQFSGDETIGCALVEGPVRDFNLMVRRGHARGAITIVSDAGVRIPPARFRLCYAATGAHECLLGGYPPIDIAADHALLVEDAAGNHTTFAVNPLGCDAVALVASIELAA